LNSRRQRSFCKSIDQKQFVLGGSMTYLSWTRSDCSTHTHTHIKRKKKRQKHWRRREKKTEGVQWMILKDNQNVLCKRWWWSSLSRARWHQISNS